MIDLKAHALKDVPKLATIVANFVFRSLFMTLIPHLEGEEVFGFAMHNVNFSPKTNNELHRPGHVKFSCPHVVVLACHPNNVDDLHIHGSPCATQNMFFIFS
jgi:hypothetical protein